MPIKSNHIDCLWVIKGISRLTGEYEECSTPVHKTTGERLLAKWKQVPARKREYLRLRMEPFTPPVLINN